MLGTCGLVALFIEAYFENKYKWTSIRTAREGIPEGALKNWLEGGRRRESPSFKAFAPLLPGQCPQHFPRQGIPNMPGTS